MKHGCPCSRTSAKHAAPGFHRARPAGGRNGPWQNDPAIAACALLRRLGKAKRVLVVTPASLKGEWEEQIRQFTDLPVRLVYGGIVARRAAYDSGVFFTVVNYEQMIHDGMEVNSRFKPDVVVLDEAQRIKNWGTKTAQAVKRLQSRYAFVLTGTPIENRIDELYSLMDFLEPRTLGSLFSFNREYYQFDERGRPSGYQNLDKLNERVAPYMMRRRKSDVETELPDRTDRQHFVKLTPKQQQVYDDNADIVARLANTAKRRPLTQKEQERLMIHLAMMRMICDTTYILDPKVRDCPKLVELEKDPGGMPRERRVKVIIFSEWERMLQLVRELCERLDLGYAWHTGSVPQQRRRAEINAFKSDPQCRVFLSTDSGSTGLNLQSASWSSTAICRGTRQSSNNASPAPGASIRPGLSPSSISSRKTPSSTACWKRWRTNRPWPMVCSTGAAT